MDALKAEPRQWETYMVMGTAKVGDKICFAQLSRPFQRVNDASRFLNHMANPPKDVCIWGSSSRGL